MITRTTLRARALRSTPNAAEQALWTALKGKQLGGHKFTRQFPVGPYFADFVCRTKKLVIELDGSQHQVNVDYDQRRNEFMLASGYSVLRVPSVSALHNVQALCETILAALEDRLDARIDAADLMFRRGENAANRERGL